MKNHILTRREFVKLSSAAAAGLTVLPGCQFELDQIPAPMKRMLGNTGFEVTTLGLGGQASLQWTPIGVNPVSIILKAVKMGINYFDTSNLYGVSQLNYGKAFRQLELIPGESGYNDILRESIFLTTKTNIFWAKPGFVNTDKVRNTTNGDHGEGTVADLKRSLSQMFGDGKGYYPKGAYVNMILMHGLQNTDEVDVLYNGLDTPLNKNENFGTLVAMRDFRDGTNFTGLNPGEEKLIRHIGFSGHLNSPAMINMIQRDQYDILECMLVPINPNDKRYLSHQYNVIPVAQAKNLGIIAMKVFAGGAMYSHEFSPSKVVRTVGSKELPSKSLVEYALTTPGIHTAIIGIGKISKNYLKCQLVQNYYAAQIAPDGMSENSRLEIEAKTGTVNDGQTNWFQLPRIGLTPPNNVKVILKDTIEITWDTAYAGDAPLSHYEVYRDDHNVATIKHIPQTTMEPFGFKDDFKGELYKVVAVDNAGNRAESGELTV